LARVLIIEDDTALQEAYSFILSTKGHTVTSAYNGKEGLEAARGKRYDVILLDIHMPVMDGLEFLRHYNTEQLAKQSAAGSGRVIVFSNMIEPEIQQKATRLGADQCILKSTMTPGGMLTLVETSEDSKDAVAA
jgi:CheY-like chemotaxis protein